MAARLGLVLLAGVLLLACPAFAQRRARPDPGDAQDQGKSWELAATGGVAGWTPRRSAERGAERNDRGRMIYTRRGVIVTDDFNSSNRPSGWDGGRKVGWGSCDESSGQAKNVGCRRSFRRWLLGRWRGWKRMKRRPPVIDQDHVRHRD